MTATTRHYIIFLLFVFAYSAHAFNKNNYTNSTVLLNNSATNESIYTLYWRVEQSNNRIFFAFQAKTLGWVGFGISEPTSGSMPGSDMVIVSVEDDGDVEIGDYYATAKAFPDEDECEDWYLVGGAQNTTEGTTTVEVWRYLTVNDTQDRIITAGLNKVVYAFGASDKLTQHSAANRGATSIEFYPDINSNTYITENDTWTLDYRGNYTLQPIVTDYVGTIFALPFEDEDKHIIKIEPIVAEATKQYVHHFLVIRCDWDAELAQKVGNSSQWSADLERKCRGQFWGWAPGMDALVLPSVAGFRVSNTSNQGLTYFAIQVHYDNPNKVQGPIDTSGIRVTFTRHLRANDAGSMAIGDPLVDGAPIPPQKSHEEYEWNCPSECTSTFAHDIHVMYSFPHMHQIGSQIWTTHWRGDQRLGELGRIDFWDFGFQQGIPMNVTIKPGDRMNVHCIYNSMDRTLPTNFSAGSSDEMCMVFLTYYPLLPNQAGWCGLYNKTSICGNDFLNITNPTIKDPAGGDEILFGEEPEDCPNEDHTSTSAVSTAAITDDEVIPDTDSDSKGSSGGKIAGAIIIILLAIAGLGAIFYFIRKHATEAGTKEGFLKKQQEEENGLNSGSSQSDRFVELE